jgi:hypothetical protein
MIMGLPDEDIFDSDNNRMNTDKLVRARLALFCPGQPMALELSKNPTVLIVNDTVFAHGSLMPRHVNYGIERINAEVAAWMRRDKVLSGGHAPPPFIAMGYGHPFTAITSWLALRLVKFAHICVLVVLHQVSCSVLRRELCKCRLQ